MKSSGFICYLIVFYSVSIFYLEAQTPAFPSAEGFGKWATGGRGGRVVYVTHVKDNIDKWGAGYKGSFRAAIETAGNDPITIVFSCSGIIQLKGEIKCTRNNITIAGQTAPGDGICVQGGKLDMGGSYNIIIRHMRFRLGLLNGTGFIPGACLGIENGGNFIIDHCSFSWSAEENTGFYDDKDITVQWCIIAEGLYNAGHPKGARGYGSVWGGSTASYHHNLLAHNVSRVPRFGTSDKIDQNMVLEYANNVNYNWGSRGACYGGENEMAANGSVKIYFVNNYYKPGPAYPGINRSYFTVASWSSMVGTNPSNFSKYYMNGNYMEGTANTTCNDNNYNCLDISRYIDAGTTAGLTVSINDLMLQSIEIKEPVIIQNAHDAYQKVLEHAGAFPRDSVDIRIIKEVRTGTAISRSSFNNYQLSGIVDKPDDSGGYPVYRTYNPITDKDLDGIDDQWEIINGMNPENPEDRNLLSPEGYTYLEVYLNGLVGEYLDGFKYITSIRKKETTQNNIKVFLDESGNTLCIDSPIGVCSCKVYNLKGELMTSLNGQNLNNLNMANFAKGAYILELITEDNQIHRYKLIK